MALIPITHSEECKKRSGELKSGGPETTPPKEMTCPNYGFMNETSMHSVRTEFLNPTIAQVCKNTNNINEVIEGLKSAVTELDCVGGDDGVELCHPLVDDPTKKRYGISKLVPYKNTITEKPDINITPKGDSSVEIKLERLSRELFNDERSEVYIHTNNASGDAIRIDYKPIDFKQRVAKSLFGYTEAGDNTFTPNRPPKTATPAIKFEDPFLMTNQPVSGTTDDAQVQVKFDYSKLAAFLKEHILQQSDSITFTDGDATEGGGKKLKIETTGSGSGNSYFAGFYDQKDNLPAEGAKGITWEINKTYAYVLTSQGDGTEALLTERRAPQIYRWSTLKGEKQWVRDWTKGMIMAQHFVKDPITGATTIKNSGINEIHVTGKTGNIKVNNRIMTLALENFLVKSETLEKLNSEYPANEHEGAFGLVAKDSVIGDSGDVKGLYASDGVRWVSLSKDMPEAYKGAFPGESTIEAATNLMFANPLRVKKTVRGTYRVDIFEQRTGYAYIEDKDEGDFNAFTRPNKGAEVDGYILQTILSEEGTNATDDDPAVGSIWFQILYGLTSGKRWMRHKLRHENTRSDWEEQTSSGSGTPASHKEAFLGIFNSPDTFYQAAFDNKPLRRRHTWGWIRKDTINIEDPTTHHHYYHILTWDLDITDPTMEQIKGPNSWTHEDEIPAKGSTIEEVGPGTIYEGWTPDNPTWEAVSARKYRGQVVFYTGNGRIYYSDGDKWLPIHSGGGVDPTGDTVIIVGERAENVTYRPWTPTSDRTYKASDHKGQLVYYAPRDILLAGIFRSAEYLTSEGHIWRWEPLMAHGDDAEFIGIYDSAEQARLASRHFKYFKQNGTFALIRNELETGTDAADSHFKIYTWGDPRKVPTDYDKVNSRNWVTKYNLASHGSPIMLVGNVNTPTQNWTPTSDTSHSHSKYKGQIVYWVSRDDATKRGLYYSDGESWSALLSGGDTPSASSLKTQVGEGVPKNTSIIKVPDKIGEWNDHTKTLEIKPVEYVIHTTNPDHSEVETPHTLRQMKQGSNIKFDHPEGSTDDSVMIVSSFMKVHGYDHEGTEPDPRFIPGEFIELGKEFACSESTPETPGSHGIKINLRHEGATLGVFDTFDELENEARRHKQVFYKGKTIGYVRHKLGDQVVAHELYTWKTTEESPTVWDKTKWNVEYFSVTGQSIVQVGNGTHYQDWTTDAPESYPANTHTGQIIFNRGTENKGFFISDGTSWSELSSSSSAGLINTKLGETGDLQPTSTIVFHEKAGTYNSVNKTLTVNPLMLKDMSDKEKPITKITAGKNILMSLGTSADDSSINTLKINAFSDTKFLGYFQRWEDLRDAAITHKSEHGKFIKGRVIGYVDREQTMAGGVKKVISYTKYLWIGTKADPTEEEIRSPDSWKIEEAPISGYALVSLGTNSPIEEFKAWTPTVTDKYPATLYPGQVVYYTNTKDFYWSDGTAWAKMPSKDIPDEITAASVKNILKEDPLSAIGFTLTGETPDKLKIDIKDAGLKLKMYTGLIGGTGSTNHLLKDSETISPKGESAGTPAIEQITFDLKPNGVGKLLYSEDGASDPLSTNILSAGTGISIAQSEGKVTISSKDGGGVDANIIHNLVDNGTSVIKSKVLHDKLVFEHDRDKFVDELHDGIIGDETDPVLREGKNIKITKETKTATKGAGVKFEVPGLTVKDSKEAGFTSVSDVHEITFDESNFSVTKTEDEKVKIEVREDSVLGNSIKVSGLKLSSTTNPPVDGDRLTDVKIKSIKFGDEIGIEQEEDDPSKLVIGLRHEGAMLGEFESETNLFNAAKLHKKSFNKGGVMGYVRRDLGASGAKETIGYKLYVWKSDTSNPDATAIANSDNWNIVEYSKKDRPLVQVGKSSEYPGWTPNAPTSYPATQAKGQFIYYTSNTVGDANEGFYSSNGSDWSKVNLGSGITFFGDNTDASNPSILASYAKLKDGDGIKTEVTGEGSGTTRSANIKINSDFKIGSESNTSDELVGGLKSASKQLTFKDSETVTFEISEKTGQPGVAVVKATATTGGTVTPGIAMIGKKADGGDYTNASVKALTVAGNHHFFDHETIDGAVTLNLGGVNVSSTGDEAANIKSYNDVEFSKNFSLTKTEATVDTPAKVTVDLSDKVYFLGIFTESSKLTDTANSCRSRLVRGQSIGLVQQDWTSDSGKYPLRYTVFVLNSDPSTSGDLTWDTKGRIATHDQPIATAGPLAPFTPLAEWTPDHSNDWTAEGHRGQLLNYMADNNQAGLYLSHKKGATWEWQKVSAGSSAPALTVSDGVENVTNISTLEFEGASIDTTASTGGTAVVKIDGIHINKKGDTGTLVTNHLELQNGKVDKDGNKVKVTPEILINESSTSKVTFKGNATVTHTEADGTSVTVGGIKVSGTKPGAGNPPQPEVQVGALVMGSGLKVQASDDNTSATLSVQGIKVKGASSSVNSSNYFWFPEAKKVEIKEVDGNHYTQIHGIATVFGGKRGSSSAAVGPAQYDEVIFGKNITVKETIDETTKKRTLSVSGRMSVNETSNTDTTTNNKKFIDLLEFSPEHFYNQFDAESGKIVVKPKASSGPDKAHCLGQFSSEGDLIKAAAKHWKDLIPNVSFGFVREDSGLALDHEDSVMSQTIRVFETTTEVSEEVAKDVTNWKPRGKLATRDHSLVVLGENSTQTKYHSWTPTDDSLYPANQHKGQMVYYASGEPATSGMYISIYESGVGTGATVWKWNRATYPDIAKEARSSYDRYPEVLEERASYSESEFVHNKVAHFSKDAGASLAISDFKGGFLTNFATDHDTNKFTQILHEDTDDGRTFIRHGAKTGAKWKEVAFKPEGLQDENYFVLVAATGQKTSTAGQIIPYRWRLHTDPTSNFKHQDSSLAHFGSSQVGVTRTGRYKVTVQCHLLHGVCAPAHTSGMTIILTHKSNKDAAPTEETVHRTIVSNTHGKYGGATASFEIDLTETSIMDVRMYVDDSFPSNAKAGALASPFKNYMVVEPITSKQQTGEMIAHGLYDLYSGYSNIEGSQVVITDDERVYHAYYNPDITRN